MSCFSSFVVRGVLCSLYREFCRGPLLSPDSVCDPSRGGIILSGGQGRGRQCCRSLRGRGRSCRSSVRPCTSLRGDNRLGRFLFKWYILPSCLSASCLWCFVWLPRSGERLQLCSLGVILIRGRRVTFRRRPVGLARVVTAVPARGGLGLFDNLRSPI